MNVKGAKIEFLGHSGFLITWKDEKIYIDPYESSENAPKADLILITHSHYDHCSIKDLEKITKEGTTIIVPADAVSKITKIDGLNMQVIEVGDELSYKDIKIGTLPAYNKRKEYHPKKEGWLGYILKFDNLAIYHAGDTDKIEEMKKLTGYGKEGNEFVAMLPVSGKYVMDAEEAAEAAVLIKPTIAIPMHYGSGVGSVEDALKFVELCLREGIAAQVMEKI